MKWFKWLEVLLRCCSNAVHLWLCHSAQSWEMLACQAVASSQAKWELRADHECLYEWLWKSMWTDQMHRVQLQICPNLLSIYFCFPDHRIGQNMEGLPIEFQGSVLNPWLWTESGLSFRRTRKQSRCAVVDLQIPIFANGWSCYIVNYIHLWSFMCVIILYRRYIYYICVTT